MINNIELILKKFPTAKEFIDRKETKFTFSTNPSIGYNLTISIEILELFNFNKTFYDDFVIYEEKIKYYDQKYICCLFFHKGKYYNCEVSLNEGLEEVLIFEMELLGNSRIKYNSIPKYDEAFKITSNILLSIIKENTKYRIKSLLNKNNFPKEN